MLFRPDFFYTSWINEDLEDSKCKEPLIKLSPKYYMSINTCDGVTEISLFKIIDGVAVCFATDVQETKDVYGLIRLYEELRTKIIGLEIKEVNGIYREINGDSQ